jgi:PKD repeat protein
VKSYGVHENTGFKLKTLNVIYILRIGFGILAALVATLVVNLKAGNPLINGITVGLAVYILTYYLLKLQFSNKVEKPTKILTMGIGAYFLTFIFCWVLFITPFLAPPTATFTITPQDPVVNNPVTFNATASFDPDGTIVKWIWDFGDENTGTGETFNHTYASAGDYTVKLKVVDDHGISSSNKTTINVPLS